MKFVLISMLAVIIPLSQTLTLHQQTDFDGISLMHHSRILSIIIVSTLKLI